LEGKEFAQAIGFPLVIRPSFTLGGTGGGFVHGKEDLDGALERGLTASPIHEVLVEKAVLGWKEFELELLRDQADNVVIICTVENLDPMGVHTGDSITVAPAMTLSDTSFQDMRNKAIMMMRSLGNFTGGCNVQFAQNPETEELIAAVRDKVPGLCLRTTLISGFPGETIDDVEETKSFLEQHRFDRVGIFTYSHEEGTSGYELKDDVPAAEKERRAQEIMSVQQEISYELNQEKVGKVFKTIIDKYQKSKI
jgi:hypothetical protein